MYNSIKCRQYGFGKVLSVLGLYSVVGNNNDWSRKVRNKATMVCDDAMAEPGW